MTGCRSAMTDADRQALAEAARFVERGQVQPALPPLDRIISRYNQDPDVAEAYYLRGLCRTKMNQMQPAALDFIQATERGGRPDLVALARISLAEIHFGWGNWSRAADLYAESVDLLEDRPPAEQILYGAGVAMQRAGRWSAARVQFARILTMPDLRTRPIARDAYLKAGWPYDYCSIQVGSFTDADKAETVARSFKERGLDVWEQLRPGTSPQRWVVLTGRYSTYAEAIAALPYVRRFQADACVVP